MKNQEKIDMVKINIDMAIKLLKEIKQFLKEYQDSNKNENQISLVYDDFWHMNTHLNSCMNEIANVRDYIDFELTKVL